MTFDFLRLYHKSVQKSREMKKVICDTMTSTLTKVENESVLTDQISKMMNTLEQDFDSQVQYLRVFILGVITMSLFWVIALFNLVLGEKQYETAMVDFFSKPFRIVFAKSYAGLQEHLANQLTVELLNHLIKDSLETMADRKDK